MTKPTETDRLFLDLFTTALEGGINYWAQAVNYHWSHAPTDYEGEQIEDFDGFGADIVDMEDGGSEHFINRDVIAAGYNHAITSHANKINWSTRQPPYVVTEQSRDDWDFDAGDADCIVQLGLFGEVRYG